MSNLEGRLVGDQQTYQVRASVEASSDAASSDDTHPTKRHRSTPRNGLAAARLLPGIAALASDRLSPRVLRIGAVAVAALLDDVWVVIWVLTEIEARVVNDISLFHHVGTHGEIAEGCLLTDSLGAGVVIGVGRSSEALSMPCLAKKSELTSIARIVHSLARFFS